MLYKITCIHVLSPCQLKKDIGKHQNINAGYLWVELTAIYKILVSKIINNEYAYSINEKKIYKYNRASTVWVRIFKYD